LIVVKKKNIECLKKNWDDDEVEICNKYT
jgi:hypothetical protein